MSKEGKRREEKRREYSFLNLTEKKKRQYDRQYLMEVLFSMLNRKIFFNENKIERRRRRRRRRDDRRRDETKTKETKMKNEERKKEKTFNGQQGQHDQKQHQHMLVDQVNSSMVLMYLKN